MGKCLLLLAVTVWILTLPSRCLAVAEQNAIIYRFGCYGESSFSANASSDLPHNFPGTCLAFCNRAGLKPLYIALRSETCKCISTDVNKTDQSSGCSQVCPGHNSHYCGNSTTAAASMYKIEYRAASQNNSLNGTRCRSFTCLKTTIAEADCENSHPVFCITDIADLRYCKTKNFNGPWELALSSCANDSDSVEYLNEQDQYQPVCSNCGDGGLGSTVYWIGSFEQWAPPKNCSPTAEELTGDKGIVIDMNTIFFNCSGNSLTRYCMANGTWSGYTPTCALGTTTTPNAGALSASAITTHITTTPTLPKSTPARSHTSTTERKSTISTNSGSANTTTASENGQNKYLIAFIVVCVLFAILLIVVIVLILYIVKLRRTKNKTSPSPTADPEPAEDSQKEHALPRERLDLLPQTNETHAPFTPPSFQTLQNRTTREKSQASTNLMNTETHLTDDPGILLNDQTTPQNNGAAPVAVDDTHEDNANNINMRQKKKKKKHKKKSRHRAETDVQPDTMEQEAWNGDDTTAGSSKTRSDVAHSDTEETFKDAATTDTVKKSYPRENINTEEKEEEEEYDFEKTYF